MKKHLPNKDFFSNKRIPDHEDYTITEYIQSGNNGHLFKAFSQSLGREIACKIIPEKNLEQAPGREEAWRDEILKANALRSRVAVKVIGVFFWKDVPIEDDANSKIRCLVIISEFVNGLSLRDFIKKNKHEVTIPFVLDWLKTTVNTLFEMNEKSIRHGDLHAGNILVEDTSAYNLRGPRFEFRITDFGVGKSSSSPNLKDDFHQTALTLLSLLSQVDEFNLSSRDTFVFDYLRMDMVERHLLETDTTRDHNARNPRKLIELLDQVDEKFNKRAQLEATELVSPFDFLSLEQIGERPALLEALYSDKFLGLDEIQTYNNVVVTGPRGCGKSTVFRSLSLNHQLKINNFNGSECKYLGVYYQCSDLYFTFPRYSLPERDEALNIPVHFLTATLLVCLLESFESWANRFFEADFLRDESRVAEKLWSCLKLKAPQTPSRHTFATIASALGKERNKASDRFRFSHSQERDLGYNFGVEILNKFCETLRTGFNFASNRPFFFYIDDYSSPKVTKALQENLNRVLMQRGPNCFFKISTESPVSFQNRDSDGKTYVEGREYNLHNLGSVYLHANVKSKLLFIEDIFSRRLAQSVEFPADSLEELVGAPEALSNNGLALQMRTDAKRKTLFRGKNVLCSLCSGDVHYIISLVSDMVKTAGGQDEFRQNPELLPISEKTQNKAIRSAAGSFVKSLGCSPKHGSELVSIVEAFGNVAHSHLKHINSKNETKSPPKQATRIEPYETPTLSTKAKEIYDELLRYSVFIEDFRGKSRRGKIVPRLFLRRCLIPHFNLTFSTRDSIELEPSDFESFLLNPEIFEKKHRVSSEEEGKQYTNKSENDYDQMKLKLDSEN